MDPSSIITQVSADDAADDCVKQPTTVAVTDPVTDPVTTRPSARGIVAWWRRCVLPRFSCASQAEEVGAATWHVQHHDTWWRHLAAFCGDFLCCCGRRSFTSASSRGGGRGHRPLLAAPHSERVCLVVDLDETLVHSSFQPVANADFIIPVDIDGVVHSVYVLKRPHVDCFLHKIGQLFECVLFTASIAKYADPVVDRLDTGHVFGARLFRDACVVHHNNFVKDLSQLGRKIDRVVIIDNSPNSYAFHRDNALAVSSWFGALDDVELLTCLPLLEQIATARDVYSVLAGSKTAPTTALPANEKTASLLSHAHHSTGSQ